MPSWVYDWSVKHHLQQRHVYIGYRVGEAIGGPNLCFSLLQILPTSFCPPLAGSRPDLIGPFILGDLGCLNLTSNQIPATDLAISKKHNRRQFTALPLAGF